MGCLNIQLNPAQTGFEAERLDVDLRKRIVGQDEAIQQIINILFEGNPQPMWVHDTETLRFIAVNDAATAQYGYTREEFLAMSLRDIRPEEDIPALLEAARVPPDRTVGPWRHRKKDGTIITVEIADHPIEFGNRNACLVMTTDITERMRLEDQLRQAQKMEAIGRLAGGVAHDFNNLLTAILGYNALIVEEVKEQPWVLECADEVRGAAERASALTNQLLAFSRAKTLNS